MKIWRLGTFVFLFWFCFLDPVAHTFVKEKLAFPSKLYYHLRLEIAGREIIQRILRLHCFVVFGSKRGSELGHTGQV